MPRIIHEKLFDLRQFACSLEHSSRDALLFLIITWLILSSSGRCICLYCSDVSGAFDNVSKNLLIQKLIVQGFPANFVNLFSSWMSERRAKVCVGGKSSRSFQMSNMVYQGTVLGSILWNLFFADGEKIIQDSGGEAICYADDLNAWTTIGKNDEDEAGFAKLEVMQQNLHS